jgi:hypothetical protein
MNQVVRRPRGLTVPVSLALVGPISWAAPERATGGPAVLKVRSAPLLVPAEFVATRR